MDQKIIDALLLLIASQQNQIETLMIVLSQELEPIPMSPQALDTLQQDRWRNYSERSIEQIEARYRSLLAGIKPSSIGLDGPWPESDLSGSA